MKISKKSFDNVCNCKGLTSGSHENLVGYDTLVQEVRLPGDVPLFSIMYLG